MRTDRARRFRIGAALVLPWVLASCSELVTPDPHAEVRGTYDMVVTMGHPLPYRAFERMNMTWIVAGTLTLHSDDRFTHVVNGVERTGIASISGDTVLLQFEDQAPIRYTREGAALVYRNNDVPTLVWVKQGEIDTTPYQYERYDLRGTDPPGLFPMMGSSIWIWKSGRFDVEYTQSTQVSREAGTYESDGETIRFDPGLQMWGASEGVLTDGTLRIGAATYAKP